MKNKILNEVYRVPLSPKAYLCANTYKDVGAACYYAIASTRLYSYGKAWRWVYYRARNGVCNFSLAYCYAIECRVVAAHPCSVECVGVSALLYW